MIVGLFLSNYKCYKNLNFIPFIENTKEKLNIFIGENGAGKSSVLEALHCIMNKVDPEKWETSIGQRRDRTFIGPVFLIKKAEFSVSEQIEQISNVFWTADFETYNNHESAKNFVEWRKNIIKILKTDDYYLFCIGKDVLGNILLTTTFNDKILNKTKRHGVSKKTIEELYLKIIGYYSYIYIPVENKISDALSLQAKEMQGLMDKSIIKEITRVLTKKTHEVEGGDSKSSIIDLINKSLNGYIEEINNKISDGYKFEAKGNIAKIVKSDDILQVILEKYFSIRPLTKDGKNIESLSSGQQRLALIDVASTLLTNDNEKEKNIILAIDEPENSLDPSHRFDQFSSLVNIAENYNYQIFLTTHWYGLLLKPSVGRLHFISPTADAPSISNFSLHNLYDQRRYFPDSIEMKSYFDLMSSMLSILKKEEVNWLICEGYEDAMYLSLYLKNKIPNTNILPFNGCGNVKKLYQFLSVPFSDKGELKLIKGKVFCLIDTDEKSLINIPNYTNNKKLVFKRLILSRESHEAKLISVADQTASNTEIEDVLDSKIMWQVLQKVSEKNTRLKNLLKGCSYNTNFLYSDLTKEMEFIEKNTKKAYQNFKELKDFLHTEEMKKNIVETYCETAKITNNLEPLPWMEEIVEYFSENIQTLPPLGSQDSSGVVDIT